MATTQTNQQYRLNTRDLLRGLLIAVMTAIISSIYEAITQGGFEAIEWKDVLAIAATAGLSYLIKNFFTANEIVITNAPQQAFTAVKQGADVKVDGTTIPNANSSNP